MFNISTKPQITVKVEKEGKTKETKHAQCSFVVPELPWKREDKNEEKVPCS